MFKRQPLATVASARPRCPVSLRVQGVRFRSEIQWGDRQRAQEKGSNTMPTNPPPEHTPTPHNQPAAGRSRQQQAAQVSEEVRMLNRGSTAATVPGNNSPYPSVRSRGVDPEAVGGNGQMGNNDSPSREGPFAASPGRVMRAGAPEDVRSEHDPNGRVLDPQQGGEALLQDYENAAEEYEEDDEFDEDDEDESDNDDDFGGTNPIGNSTPNSLVVLEQFDKQDITPVSFEPESVTRDDFLKLGQGGATIAAGNFAGVIEDRIKLVAESTQDDFRYIPDIAARMLKGELVSFKDDAERQQVLDHIKKTNLDFAPLSSNSQNAIFDKLVRGAYPDHNAAPHKQKILNEVARTISRNSSYLGKDSTKLLRKIGSLLPSEAAARKPQQQKK